MGDVTNPALYECGGRWHQLRRLFEIDLRALVVFRVGMGLLLLTDIYLRFRVLVAHHTDAGVLPRYALSQTSRTSILSPYMLNGDAPFAAFLLSLTAIFAVMLIVGYKTRLVTFLCWFLLMSVQRRNPLVINSGDVLFCILFFWSMFLPLGTRASIDSRGTKNLTTHPPPRAIFSAATVAILLQMIYVYVCSAILKKHPIWRTEGSAVYFALNVDRLVSIHGLKLREYYEVMKFMTFATFYFELIGPFLAFVPVGRRHLRTLIVFMFIGFHLGLAVTMHLVLFPFICITAWILFLPSEFWDFVSRFKVASGISAGWSGVIAKGTAVAASAGRLLKPLEPRVAGWRLGLFEQIAVVLLTGYVFFWNVASCSKSINMPSQLRPLASVLWISQNWGMFAPYPLKDDGWLVIPARLADGKEIDLLTGLPPTFEKPENVAMTFHEPRWRKFMENIWRGKHRPKVVFYAGWLRNTWNQQHDPSQHIEAMQCYHVVEFTYPYPEEPYLSPPLLMYEWEGPGTDHWITFKQNQKSYKAGMRRDRRRQLEEFIVQPTVQATK